MDTERAVKGAYTPSSPQDPQAIFITSAQALAVLEGFNVPEIAGLTKARLGRVLRKMGFLSVPLRTDVGVMRGYWIIRHDTPRSRYLMQSFHELASQIADGSTLTKEEDILTMVHTLFAVNRGAELYEAIKKNFPEYYVY